MHVFKSFQDLANHYCDTGMVSDMTVFNSEQGFYGLLDKIKSFKRNERHGEGKQISSTLKNRIIEAVKEIAEVPDPSARETMKGDLWVALYAYETGEQASRDAARAFAVSGNKTDLPYTDISLDAMKRAKTPDGSTVNSLHAAYYEGIENCRRAGMIVNDLEFIQEEIPIEAPPAVDSLPVTPFISVDDIGDAITIDAGGTTITISAPPEMGLGTENGIWDSVKTGGAALIGGAKAAAGMAGEVASKAIEGAREAGAAQILKQAQQVAATAPAKIAADVKSAIDKTIDKIKQSGDKALADQFRSQAGNEVKKALNI